MDRKELRRVLVAVVADSRSREPKGVDSFVDDLAQALGPDALINTYKLAWTKLAELLVILSKAGCGVLDPQAILDIMTYLLTSSVCIKDKATATS